MAIVLFYLFRKVSASNFVCFLKQMMMIVGAEAILGVVGAGDAEAMAQEAVAVSGAQEVTVMVSPKIYLFFFF